MIGRFLRKAKTAFHVGKRIFITDRLDGREDAFIKHNQAIWGSFLQKQGKGEILLESFNVASSIIAFSYLANLLARMHEATITGYIIQEKNLKSIILNWRINRIYKSFNVKEFTYYKLTDSQLNERERLYEEIYHNLKTTRDVENLTVEGVYLGDLLYDSHLQNYQVPTLDIEDERFRNSLKNSLGYYIYWRDYFDSHDVKSVILTHCVYYQSATILRVAIHKQIPVYQITAIHVHHMNKDNLLAYTEFFYFPEEFRELPKEEQEKGLNLAKERLQKRFSGEAGVDMYYSTKSAYGKTVNKRILSESPKIKILIATHCFFDSPHPYGINLFPDFYEWLSFLGELSESTDYEWYIKTHPDFLPGNIPIIEELARKYPRFKVIPAETSHLQLIEEGIDFALTVWGSIGYEYAALGVPVVNASMCNPHVRYSFNLHPKTIEEYRSILLNLPNIKIEINLDEVYEYYYMQFIHSTQNWLFDDYHRFVSEIGGYIKQVEPISYEKFLAEFTTEKHERILSSLNKFLIAGDFWLQNKHMD